MAKKKKTESKIKPTEVVTPEKPNDGNEFCNNYLKGKCFRCYINFKRGKITKNVPFTYVEEEKPKEIIQCKKERKLKVIKKKTKKIAKSESVSIEDIKEKAPKLKKPKRTPKIKKETIEKEVKEPKKKKEVKTPKLTRKAKAEKPKKTPKPKKEKTPKPLNTGYFMMTKKTKLEDDDCEEFLKDNCDSNYCKKIHNFSKKFKNENNVLFAKRLNALNQDFLVIRPYEQKIYGKYSLDLMFIMDCTGSMGSWISTCKTELTKIIDEVKIANPSSPVNISFVGFRDHCDSNRLTFIDFNPDVDEVKQFINKVNATGGGDQCEDVAGGLRTALNQSWSASAKYAVLICDAPCHGSKYHVNCGDNYPKGDPNGLIIEDLIEEFGKKEISLYGISINSSTDKMFEIMNDSFFKITNKKIKIENLGNSTKDFAFFVSRGASNTLSSVTVGGISLKEFINNLQNGTMIDEGTMDNDSVFKMKTFLNRLNSLMEDDEINKAHLCTLLESSAIEIKDSNPFELKQEIKELNYEIATIKPDKINFDNLSNTKVKARCYTFYIPKDRNSNINWKNIFIKNSFIDSEVLIADKPFSEGAMRYAFYMKDIGLEQDLVCKLPKKLVKAEYNLDHLSKDILSISVCHYIASDFNERIVNLLTDTKLLLNFVNGYIYELTGFSDTNDESKIDNYQQFYYVENYMEGDYEKFNNNAGWINDKMSNIGKVAQAFSHFSWQITKGFLMIVDLQGVGAYLTDPQIHCLDRRKFGKGNLGYVGILKFFMSHHCNEYCRKLELVHPRQNFTISPEYDFFVEKFVPPDDFSQIWKVCDICKVPYKAKAIDLYNQRKKCWESYCPPCDKKRKDTFKWGQCSMCTKKFVSSGFWFKMKRMQFPDKCNKCRIETRTDERKGFESRPEEDIKEDGMMDID